MTIKKHNTSPTRSKPVSFRLPQKPRIPYATEPVLRFSPTAWAKLHFFCHQSDVEIGGFGVASPEDLLLVEEFITVRQRTTAISVVFDDEAVAEFFESQVDAGRKPEQFARLWLHTHPGDCPTPSAIDEETFSRVFGRCDWAIMFILGRAGKTHARLRFNMGPGGALLIPVHVDYSQDFAGSDREAWKQEYERNIHGEPLAPGALTTTGRSGWNDDWPEELEPTLQDELLHQAEEREFNELFDDEREVIL